MLKLTKRGKAGIWQIKGSLNGQRYRESTGTNSRVHAEALLAKRQNEVLDRAVWGGARTSTFAEAVVYYLEKGGEARFLAPLVNLWGDRRIADITESEVSTATHKLYPGRTAAWHVRSVYTPLNSVIRKAHRAEMCELRVFDKPTVRTVPVKYARDDWFELVLPKCSFRLATTILFLTLTGARVQEACNVLPKDVDVERGEVTLRHTKNGTERVVKLAPVLLEAVATLCRATRPGGRVFGFASRWSVNQAIRRACERAGAEYLSSHKVGRHAFAARLLREGHSLKMVQEGGGWKVARMVSEHYGHLERSHVDAAVSGVGTDWAQLPSQFTTHGRKSPQILDKSGGRDRDRTCDPYHVKAGIKRIKGR